MRGKDQVWCEERVVKFESFAMLTCGLPQSQASFSSWIPLPQTGSPTVLVGSLVRQRPRL